MSITHGQQTGLKRWEVFLWLAAWIWTTGWCSTQGEMQTLPNLCFKLSTKCLGPWVSACRGPSCELCEILNVKSFAFHFHVNNYSCPSRIEYEDRQESLLRALQQNVTRETQMVSLVITCAICMSRAFVSNCCCAFHRWWWSCLPIERTSMTVWRSTCVWTALLLVSVWCLAPSANLKRLWLWPPRLLCRWTAKWEESCGV